MGVCVFYMCVCVYVCVCVCVPMTAPHLVNISKPAPYIASSAPHSMTRKSPVCMYVCVYVWVCVCVCGWVCVGVMYWGSLRAGLLSKTNPMNKSYVTLTLTSSGFSSSHTVLQPLCMLLWHTACACYGITTLPSTASSLWRPTWLLHSMVQLTTLMRFSTSTITLVWKEIYRLAHSWKRTACLR